MKYLILLAALALAVPATAQTTPAAGTATAAGVVATADGRPTAYATEYDSLQQRAARVRTRTEAQIGQFKSSFVALHGTSRRIKSFARLNGVGTSPLVSHYPLRLVKKEIVKHKTRTADVHKVYYYDVANRLLLQELYQQRQLVRVELNEYPVRRSARSGRPFRTTLWLRGDYLSVTIRNAVEAGVGAGTTVQQYCFTAPRQPE